MSKTTIPKGYTFAGVKCGLKKDEYDLALVKIEPGAIASGLFTQNKVRAACVDLSQKHAKNTIKGIVINSKNANALTGTQGKADTKKMAELAAAQLGCEDRNVIVASTGVIGQPLPMDFIEEGIYQAANSLKPQPNNVHYAILTTDKYSKKMHKTVTIDGVKVHFFAMAKGAGMIHPNMATMLVFIMTDANIQKSALTKAHKDVVNKTFNKISVDGDTSTNDMAFLFASRLAGNKSIATNTPAYETFKAALFDISAHLATLIVRDGEGATKAIKVQVTHAHSQKAALAIARTIATSSLVKTAYYGSDANWGRILAAAGNADVPFNPENTTLTLNKIKIYTKGRINRKREHDLALSMKKKDQEIVLDCGYETEYEDLYYFSDLTHDYVSINANYRT